jgi:hypothetical protein
MLREIVKNINKAINKLTKGNVWQPLGCAAQPNNPVGSPTTLIDWQLPIEEKDTTNQCGFFFNTKLHFTSWGKD